MDRIEAINIRRSVRAYSAEEIRNADIGPLLHEMDTLNKENGMAMEWIRDGSSAFKGITRSYGMFKGVRSIISVKGKKDDPDLREKAGYCGEVLALEAVIAGLGTCFVGGTYDRSMISVPEDEELVMVMTIGYPAEKETFRQRLIKKFMHKDASADGYITYDQEPPQWVLTGLNASTKAPSALNRKPVRFRYDGELTIYVEDESGFNMTDMGAAKANFETAAGGSFERGNHARFVRDRSH